MAAQIGSMYVALNADLRSLHAGFAAGEKRVRVFENRATLAAKNISSTFASAFGTAGNFVGLAIGATAIVRLVGAARRAIGEVGELADAADRAGVSAERLQIFREAMEQTAGSAANADAALTKFNVSLGQAANKDGGPAATAFKALGIAVEDSMGHIRDSGVVFDELFAKLAAIDSPARRAALASQIFGKSAGPEVAVLLGQGGAALERYRQSLIATGRFMSNDMVAAGDRLDNEFKKISGFLDTTWKQALIGAGDVLWRFLEIFTSVENQTNLGHLQNELSTVTGALEKVNEEIDRLTAVRHPKDPGLVKLIAGRGDIEGVIKTIKDRIEALELKVPVKPGLGTGDPGDSLDFGGGDAAKKKIDEVSAALKLQADQLGRTGREQFIFNQLAEAGVGINSAAGRAIADAAGSLFDQQRALENVVAGMDALRDTSKEALSTFVSGLRQGKTATEALGDALNRIADKLIDMASNNLIAGLFGGGGTPGRGLLGSLFPRLFGGGAAAGAPMVLSGAQLHAGGMRHEGVPRTNEARDLRFFTRGTESYASTFFAYRLHGWSARKTPAREEAH